MTRKCMLLTSLSTCCPQCLRIREKVLCVSVSSCLSEWEWDWLPPVTSRGWRDGRGDSVKKDREACLHHPLLPAQLPSSPLSRRLIPPPSSLIPFLYHPHWSPCVCVCVCRNPCSRMLPRPPAYFCLPVYLGSEIGPDNKDIFLRPLHDATVHVSVFAPRWCVSPIHRVTPPSHHPLLGEEFFRARVALVTVAAICVCCMNVWLRVPRRKMEAPVVVMLQLPHRCIIYLIVSRTTARLLGYNSCMRRD